MKKCIFLMFGKRLPYHINCMIIVIKEIYKKGIGEEILLTRYSISYSIALMIIPVTE